MLKKRLVAILMGAVSAVWALSASAQVSGQPPQVQLPEPTLKPSLPEPQPAPQVQPTPDMPLAAPEALPAAPEATPPAGDQPPLTAAPPSAPTDPVVAIIRAKLADPAIGKDANADDRAALSAFYGTRTEGPMWITEMGFSAKGQRALFEIAQADDWGLDAATFDLPPAGELPASAEAQALAEIKLDFAILKYARYASGGRFTPAAISALFDQTPPLRDPNTVLAEIAAAEAPDAYLQSLHPKHQQFAQLRQALLEARGKSGESKPADKDIKRLVINMERWRWLPEELGSIYVWNNSPEFKLYVVKDGKAIFGDKTLVGTIGYATPVFTSPMTTIVFNPDWVAPETVVKENIWPPLQRRAYSILKTHKLSVSYNGKRVDPTKVDWNRVNPLSFTFSQKAGPHNNLGKVKFLYPNRHTVYMHDTLPVRKKYFKQSVRMIGHECVRMEKPIGFAEVLLAEANGWSTDRVKELWDKGDNSSVALDKKIPVHMVYFTSVVDDSGKVEIFADVYGLDRKLAAALFGDTTSFPQPPPEPPKSQAQEADATPVNRGAGRSDIMQSMQSFFGD